MKNTAIQRVALRLRELGYTPAETETAITGSCPGCLGAFRVISSRVDDKRAILHCQRGECSEEKIAKILSLSHEDIGRARFNPGTGARRFR
jgi:hypothetical protein